MKLRTFASYNIVVPIVTTESWFPFSEVMRCLSWMDDNGFPVLLRNGTPAIRIENGRLWVETPVAVGQTADGILRDLSERIPDPWRVNARGYTDRLPPKPAVALTS